MSRRVRAWWFVAFAVLFTLTLLTALGYVEWGWGPRESPPANRPDPPINLRGGEA